MHDEPMPAADGGATLLSRRRALAGAAALCLPVAFARESAASPLAAGSRTVAGGRGVLLLDSNENPYGPSPAARQAILHSLGDVPRYARDSLSDLSAAAGAALGASRDQVMIGTGSGELLHVITLLALDKAADAEVIAAKTTYEELPGFAKTLGARIVAVPLDGEHRHDLERMRAAVTPHTRLIYVCNPNNPTGTAVPQAALQAFIRSLPREVLVAVDEAYIDLVDPGATASVVGLVGECPNLVVLRTFSKLHGLAGLRIGYSIATPELTKRLRDWQLTWPNTVGVHAALASLGDHAFQTETRRLLVEDRNRVHATLDRLSRPRTRAQGNFVFFDTGKPLAQFSEQMLAEGIRVGRHFEGYDQWARISIGRRPEIDRLLEVLPRVLARPA